MIFHEATLLAAAVNVKDFIPMKRKCRLRALFLHAAKSLPVAWNLLAKFDRWTGVLRPQPPPG
jgi:hypothetical protein